MRAVLFVMVMAGVAHASPAAEKLFQDGKKLVAEGKLAEGCDALRKSNELEPRVGTLLNLGDCEEKRGRTATAWETFTSARALANQKGDARGAEADKRATALAAKLPYLTVRAPAARPAGLVVKRDGKEVPGAELDHEVPIDPGTYQLEASAIGYLPWKQTAVIAAGQKQTISIELAADPAMAKPGHTTTIETAVVEPTPPPTAPPPAIDTAVKPSLTGKRRIGAGAAIGLSSDSDLIYGIRLPIQLTPVGVGAIRAVPSLFYANFNDPDDVYHEIELYAVGLGIEYVHPIAPTFFIAGGAGFGIDFIDDNYADAGKIEKQVWGALRVSPTLKVLGSLDIGLHLQVVRTEERTVGLGELGLDYFFY